MVSRAAPEFWQLYHELPAESRAAARRAYQVFSQNPAHPSLRLERLRFDPRAWSVRVTRHTRGCPATWRPEALVLDRNTPRFRAAISALRRAEWSEAIYAALSQSSATYFQPSTSRRMEPGGSGATWPEPRSGERGDARSKRPRRLCVVGVNQGVNRGNHNVCNLDQLAARFTD